MSLPRVLAELAPLATVPSEAGRVRGEVDGEDLPRRMLVNRVHEDLQFEDPIILSIMCNVPGLT